MTGHTYYSQMVVISNIYIYDHTSCHSHCLGGYCQLYPKYIKMDQVIIWQSWLSLILQYMTVPETYPNGSLVMTTIDKFRPVIVSPILLQSCPKRWDRWTETNSTVSRSNDSNYQNHRNYHHLLKQLQYILYIQCGAPQL